MAACFRRLQPNAGEFHYRSTGVFLTNYSLGTLDLGVIGGFYSAKVDASSTPNSVSASGDLICGLIKFLPFSIPGTFMAYVKASASATALNTSAGAVVNYDYSAAGGFILTGYVRLEESDPTGKVVRTIKLKELVWKPQSGSNNGLHYLQLTGSNGFVLSAQESISFTFLVSEKLGVVDFGAVETYVTPKTLESVIEISNYVYQDKLNKLTLVTGVLTGGASKKYDVIATLSSGDGDSKVYATFSKDVDLSGRPGKVVVTASAGATFAAFSDDAAIEAVAKAVYKAGIEAKMVTIQFPAGEPNIVYDPTIGAGDPLGSNSVAIVVSLIGCLIALLI